MTIQEFLNPAPAPTRVQVLQAFDITVAVTEAIRQAGAIPSGHLYVMLIGKLDMQAYEKLIAMLVRTRLVTKDGDLLRWSGPALREVA